MKLLVIESPGKKKTIEKYLGSGWKVVASFGHIRGLVQSIDFIKNDFNASYEFLKEKLNAIKQIKDLAKEAEEIYLGADKDYEGEQIAYSVCLLLKLDPNIAKRVAFTEITEKALKYAIENPTIINMNRVNTQKARAMMDMMIGFTMSPILWRHVAPSLSAGRCQIPAIRLIVEREEKINNFKSSSSWKLQTKWRTDSGLELMSHMDTEIEDEESVVNYMENIHNMEDGYVVSTNMSKWSEKAPEPLITSTLQQQASAMYGINPKNTMKIAQKLYEAGYITYMRTDKAILSDDAKNDAKRWVNDNYGTKYVALLGIESNERKKDGKNIQEAHEAIRPTKMDVKNIDGEWTSYDKKIYNLIWQRTIQSVMQASRGDLYRIVSKIDGDDDFNWISEWKNTSFEGWKIVGKVANLEDEMENTEDIQNTQEMLNRKDVWENVKKIKGGDKLKWMNMKGHEKETKASTRFTEAMIIRELEKYGIGRPSTFASLLATIQEKNYVEIKNIPAKEILVKEYILAKPNTLPIKKGDIKKMIGAEKNKLVPTELGRSVLKFMLSHFNDLFEYKFTSEMEKRLDRISEGVENWKDILQYMWDSYKDRYEELISSGQKEKSTKYSMRIKEFANGIKAIQTKKGPLLLEEKSKKKGDTIFLGWPSGILFEDITEEQVINFKSKYEEDLSNNILGEWNSKSIIKKSGKFGEYIECGDISVPFILNENIDKTIDRLEVKQGGGGKNIIKEYKEYVIRNGPYGPYIMKTNIKKAQFISLQKDVDPNNLTEKDVEALYKAGLESKKKWNRVKRYKK